MSPFGETALCVSLNARGWLSPLNSRLPLPSRALPFQVHAFARRYVLGDPIEGLGDVVGRAAFGVGPIRGEDIVGAAPEQQVERLAEQLPEFFVENRVVPEGSGPAAELEPTGGVFF